MLSVTVRNGKLSTYNFMISPTMSNVVSLSVLLCKFVNKTIKKLKGYSVIYLDKTRQIK